MRGTEAFEEFYRVAEQRERVDLIRRLRGLRRRSGRCPECGRGVDAVLGEFEQASLDGRARRRFGAALLIGNHLAWLSMMAGWFLYIRADLRAALTLLAAAGPRSVTAIEIIKPGTLRTFSTTVFMLLALHLVGLRLLTTVFPFERLRDLRRLGHQLWATQIVAAAAAITLFVTTSPTTLRLIIWLNLVELPVGLVLGAYFARLGTAEGDQRIEVGGRAVSLLLAISSLVISSRVAQFPVPSHCRRAACWS